MNSRTKRTSQGLYGSRSSSTTSTTPAGAGSHGPGGAPALGGGQGGGGGGSGTKTAASVTAVSSVASHQGEFQEAVRNGDACGLQRVLEELQNKVDVNCYNNDGQTALHQSCQDGNLELVKLLVQFGADVRLANRDGWSALHIAAWGGHRDIAMYLINAYKR